MQRVVGRHRIGVVVNRVEDYVLPVVRGLGEVLHGSGASLLVLAQPPDESGGHDPWLRRLVRAGAVDGLVLTGVVGTWQGIPSVDALVSDLGGHGGVPLVTLGSVLPGVPDVSCDNADAVRALVDHVVRDAGRRHPLLLAGPEGNTDSAEREDAARRAFAAHGVALTDDDVVRGDFARELAYRRLGEALARRAAAGAPCVDAVLAVNDEMALGALDALAVAGLRVPDDVVVTGFDDTLAARTSRPRLTTVDQQLVEQGRQVAALLLDQLAGRPVPQRVRTPYRLVVRSSTTAPGDPTTDDLEGALAAARAEVDGVRRLLDLQQGLLGASDETTLTEELAAHVPRTDVRRMLLVRAREGRARLLWASGTEPVVAGQETHALEELLPPSHRDELDRGTLVVHLLGREGRESGLLVHEQADLDRWTGQALEQGLSGALETLRRTDELTAYAIELERQVDARTSQLQRANQRLHAALLVDGLTGVQNRIAFDEALAAAWAEHQDGGGAFAVLMCDVDRFKLYNDTAGHLAGDGCLREVASCVADAVRGRDDLVARFGGEEFAVLLPGADEAGAAQVARRVLERVRAARLAHPGLGPGGTVSLSIGVASTAGRDDLRSADDLVRRADAALYRAKAAGRDRVESAGTDLAAVGSASDRA